LRQADNIKNQLFDLLKNCRVDACKKFYKNDQNYIDFLEMKQHYKDSLPPKYKAALLRKSLAIAFYFSTARLSGNG
jgi:heme oxygenase